MVLHVSTSKLRSTLLRIPPPPFHRSTQNIGRWPSLITGSILSTSNDCFTRSKFIAYDKTFVNFRKFIKLHSQPASEFLTSALKEECGWRRNGEHCSYHLLLVNQNNPGIKHINCMKNNIFTPVSTFRSFFHVPLWMFGSQCNFLYALLDPSPHFACYLGVELELRNTPPIAFSYWYQHCLVFTSTINITLPISWALLITTSDTHYYCKGTF